MLGDTDINSRKYYQSKRSIPKARGLTCHTRAFGARRVSERTGPQAHPVYVRPSPSSSLQATALWQNKDGHEHTTDRSHRNSITSYSVLTPTCTVYCVLERYVLVYPAGTDLKYIERAMCAPVQGSSSNQFKSSPGSPQPPS